MKDVMRNYTLLYTDILEQVIVGVFFTNWLIVKSS